MRPKRSQIQASYFQYKLKRYRVLSLSNRSTMHDLCFFQTIVNNSIDFPSLLHKISISSLFLHQTQDQGITYRVSSTDLGSQLLPVRFLKPIVGFIEYTMIWIWYVMIICPIFKRKWKDTCSLKKSIKREKYTNKIKLYKVIRLISNYNLKQWHAPHIGIFIYLFNISCTNVSIT